MNRFFKKHFATWLVVASGIGSFAELRGVAAETNPAATDSIQRLELLDGSVLRGRLHSIDASKGLAWEHPDVKKPIAFKPENLAWVRFPNSNEALVPAGQGTCQFQFVNGDEFFGNVVSLDEKEAELQTWFGGKIKTPRETLRSIRFFPKGIATIYEGPTGIDDWKLGRNQNAEAWKFSEGAFIANAAGTLGRDLQLPDASRFEFDLSWNSAFSLLFCFYTGTFDNFNYNSSSYLFYINPGSVSLQRINAGAGSSSMGRTETIMSMLTKRTAHMEFRANKAENYLELLVDGQRVNQWKDNAGWVGKGSGVLFYAQTDGVGLKISNIKVSEWDGNSAAQVATITPPAEDQVLLANRDKVSGELTSVQDGKLKFKSDAGVLAIPLQRVTQIVFSGARTSSVPANPWEIQASVLGGGKISFTLQEWTREKILGENKHFGPISLNAKSIRQIRFNPEKTKASSQQIQAPADIHWDLNAP